MPPTPSAAPDGGPIPPGTTYRSTTLTPDDAPRLLARLTETANDPKFAARLDPAVRDLSLSHLRTLVDAPDALDRIRAAITAENTDSATRNASGRLPGDATDEQLRIAGVPQDRIADFHDTPAPPAPTTTVPHDPAAPPTAAVVGTPVAPSIPDNLTATSVTPTGGSWPDGSPTAWPVAGGTHGDRMMARLALLDPPGTPTYDVAPRDCGLATTGSRHLPSDPVPAFTGRIFTPAQDTFASTDRQDGRTPGTVVTYSGDLQTRMDPEGSGIRQFKVEANLISPVLVNGNLVRPDVLQGHILVSKPGVAAPESYFSNSPHTEWHTYCYAEDLGQTDVHRAYVEAWIPLDFTGPAGAGPAISADEPGFQVRFESIDNCWDTFNNCQPAYFYGADQSTVVLQRKNGPLPYSSPVPGGSLSARVSDKVLVERDQDPTNDLESILKAKILPQVGPALQQIAGVSLGIPPFASVKVQSAHAYNWDIDLDLKPIAGDDEYEFTASAGFHSLRISGYYTLAFHVCPFEGDLAADVALRGRVNIKQNDASKLDLAVTSTTANVGLSNFFSFWDLINPTLSLTCQITNYLIDDLAVGLAESEATDHLAPTLDQQLAEPVGLDVGDVVKPGTGSRFDTGLASFVRSCPPRGCQGGDELIDKDGLAVIASLNVKDAKASNDPRRFPLVFNPSLDRSLGDQYVPNPLTDPLTNPDGRAYAAAVAVHPATVNQVLRAITEGNGTTDPGVLNSSTPSLDVSAPVAPFLLDESLLPNQPAFTVFFPDLRLRTNFGGDTDNLFSANAIVGLDLGLDATSHKLSASATMGIVWNTLRCGFDTLPTIIPRQYDLCADTSWEGSPQKGIPGIAQVLNTLSQQLLPNAVTQSFDQVGVPNLEGAFDLTRLGDTEIRNVGGYLTLFVGMPVVPGVDVSAVGASNMLTVTAAAKGLPGNGPITYDIEVDDLNGSHVFHPPPSTSPTVTDSLANYFTFATKYSLKPRRIRVVVSASRNNSTVNATKDLVVP